MTTGFQKDFRGWCDLKQRIHSTHVSPLFRAGEIWWCSIGVNIGAEIDGKHNLRERPVYVVRKCGPEMFFALPLTSKTVDEKPYYARFMFRGTLRVAILSQARFLSGKRLVRRIGKVSDAQAAALRNGVGRYLAETEKETDPLRGPRVPNGSE